MCLIYNNIIESGVRDSIHNIWAQKIDN
ncbi:hypothetical protein BAPKO_6026 (plasmid) [Borreliella afzelii PKo]|nr:hypothetical protein BAPKO_6026 [Borreliella afzelii PKo]